MFQIWPSLISADLLNLAAVIKQLSDHCYGWHIDIMDNHYVPNLTWGAQFVNAIAQHSSKPLWIHLMIDNPNGFLDRLQIPAGSIISFHIETTKDVTQTIKRIKAKGWQASITLNPDQEVMSIELYLKLIDHMLIMSVKPGFSGQTFIQESLEKIKQLKATCVKQNSNPLLAIDGGINRDNIVAAAELGITQFAIASGIFAKADPSKELKQLYALLHNKKSAS